MYMFIYLQKIDDISLEVFCIYFLRTATTRGTC
jgi:hypothetical protein